jgi:outer membrane protein
MQKSLALGAAAFCLLTALPVLADERPWYTAKSDGDWLVRLRGIAVVPDESLSADGIPGANAEVDDAYVPELDITYFFTPNIALELILATTPHDVSGRGALSGADIGDVWLLPPTLTLQYHVTQFGAFKPYVGAGVNYTIFYNADAGQFDSIDYDDAFGFALQAGFDYEVAEGWYFNVDVKKLWLETEWKINGGAIRGDVTLDPWIFGVGIGYRF